MKEFYVFLGIVYLILCMVSGLITTNKGRGGALGFFLAFFLSPIIGIVIASLVKPSKELEIEEAIKTGQLKKCPKCAEMIKSEALKCRYCGEEFPS
jgi:hypothetical protein